MNQLIKLTSTTIGDDIVQTINARELHSFLDIGKDFTTWIKDRIDQYDFKEGQDYVLTFPKIGERKNVKITEYHLSLDMAKELSMVERNDKGKEARQYFIDCEKKARQLSQSVSVVTNRKRSPSIPSISTRAKMYLNIAREMIGCIPGLKPELVYAHTLDQIRVSTGEDVSQIMRSLPSVASDELTLMNATQLSKHVDLSAKAVNKILYELGLIYKDDSNKWRLTESGTAFGEMKPFHRNGHSDYEIRWKESVIDVLMNHLTQPAA